LKAAADRLKQEKVGQSLTFQSKAGLEKRERFSDSVESETIENYIGA